MERFIGVSGPLGESVLAVTELAASTVVLSRAVSWLVVRLLGSGVTPKTQSPGISPLLGCRAVPKLH